MTTLAEGEGPPPASLRDAHDRLEAAYFALARTSGRWFEKRSSVALMGGFAGLDSSTMNRVALVDARDARELDRALADAALYFGERNVPWSVQLTPFSRPGNVEALLADRGFLPALELSVMTLPADAPLPRADADASVREVRADEVGRFTSLTVDAFRMPARFLPALVDVNEAWIRAGARAYVASVEGENVATSLLAPSPANGGVERVTGIYNVATLRAWRKRGIATLLMQRLISDHRSAGGGTLTLQVATGSPAERLYENMGFVKRYAWRLFARS